MKESSSKEEFSKQILIFWRIVVFGAPVLFLLLLIIRFILKIPVSNWVFLGSIYFLFSIYLLPRIKSSLILAFVIISGMIVSALLIYFFMPPLINFLGSILLATITVYIFFIGNIFNLSLGRGSIYFFLIISSLLSSLLLLCQYFGWYPRYSGYLVYNHYLKDNPHLFFSLLMVTGGLSFFAFHIDTLLSVLRDKIEELNKTRSELLETNSGLEGKVRERTSGLEEAKTVLEVKVQARTRELAGLTEGLEQEVKERTKELQKNVEDLEKFNKLTFGRELKMKELKEHIENLKKTIQSR